MTNAERDSMIEKLDRLDARLVNLKHRSEDIASALDKDIRLLQTIVDELTQVEASDDQG